MNSESSAPYSPMVGGDVHTVAQHRGMYSREQVIAIMAYASAYAWYNQLKGLQPGLPIDDGVQRGLAGMIIGVLLKESVPPSLVTQLYGPKAVTVATMVEVAQDVLDGKVLFSRQWASWGKE